MRHEGHSRAQRHRDPFTWRLAEIAALRRDGGHDARIAQLTDELLVAEASEVSRGLRHVSITHGEPTTAMAAEQVETFVSNVNRMVPVGWWTRRGDADHLIITVGGDGAEETVRQLAGVAELCNPGHWHVSRGARPGVVDRA